MSSQSQQEAGSPAIQYIREDIPAFEALSYPGERYEAMVPDTLDLAERAALAVNGLTGPTAPEADHEVYMHAYFHHNPPVMDLNWPGSSLMMLFSEALPLMRIISGSDINTHVDPRWMEVTLKMQGPDGLTYLPWKGRPWAATGSPYPVPPGEHYAFPFYSARLLPAISLYYLLGGEQVWREAGERIVQGLLAQSVVDRGDYAFIPIAHFRVGESVSQDATMPSTDLQMYFGPVTGWVILGLTRFYLATGYEPAIELARKVCTFLRDHSGFFDAEGRYGDSGPEGPGRYHFQDHATSVVSMIDFALAVEDQELLDYLRRSYEFAGTLGEPLVGYFPEHYQSAGVELSETCEVGQMTIQAVKLSRAGVGDYWDDADRWVRNQLAENQLLRIDWIDPLIEDLAPSVVREPSFTSDRVAERNIGAFAGWPAANDWFGVVRRPHRGRRPGPKPSIMHCCTANGARALYYVWENVLTYEEGKLRVNLLLNRASPWADVDSYIPYEGQVDVRVKVPCRLSIRIPEWVAPGETQCQVEGNDRALDWEGRYANVGVVKPGDVVSLTFPIQERQDVVFIEKQRYHLVRKGNEVVAIYPPGRYCPLYQRAHYLGNAARWKRVTRFVSERQVDW